MSHHTAATLARRAAAAALAATALTFAGAATAAAPKPTVKAVHNAAAGTIVANAKGMTLYALTPETSKKVLCDASCTPYWPPLTVKSANAKPIAGAGIRGKLTVFRSGGAFRVALRGLPLYRFIGDTKAGQTHGDKAHTFGGTWHVVKAK